MSQGTWGGEGVSMFLVRGGMSQGMPWWGGEGGGSTFHASTDSVGVATKRALLYSHTRSGCLWAKVG